MTIVARADHGLKPTSARPRTVDGITFNSFYTGGWMSGSNRATVWVSEDGRISIRQAHNYSGYFARVDDKPVLSTAKVINPQPKKFRYMETAVRAAIKALEPTP